jgi:hypothetical protein
MPGKHVSAADMLNRRRDQPTQEQVAEEFQHIASEQTGRASPGSNVPVTSALVVETPTYERITVYLRPDQRAWLEEVLDRDIRDASHKRIRSISVSDIIRLAIDRLQGAVQEDDFPLLQELISAANRDAETFVGRKNRGIPKR